MAYIFNENLHLKFPRLWTWRRWSRSGESAEHCQGYGEDIRLGGGEDTHKVSQGERAGKYSKKKPVVVIVVAMVVVVLRYLGYLESIEKLFQRHHKRISPNLLLFPDLLQDCRVPPPQGQPGGRGWTRTDGGRRKGLPRWSEGGEAQPEGAWIDIRRTGKKGFPA